MKKIVTLLKEITANLYRYKNYISLSFIIFAGIYVQWPNTSLFFLMDDFAHLYNICNQGFLKFLFIPWGGHLLVFNNFILFLLYKFFHLNSFYYKIFILSIHSINIILLYKILRSLISEISIVLLGTLIWAICPVHSGTLSAFCVFGHVYATLFFLLLLSDIIKINLSRLSITPLVIVRWYLYLFCLATSFGVGLAIAFFFPCITWFFFYLNKKRWFIFKTLSPLMIILPALYFGLHSFYLKFISIVPVPEKTFSELVFPAQLLNSVFNIMKMFIGLVGYGVSSLILGPLLATEKLVITTGLFKGVQQITLLCIFLFIALLLLAGIIFALKRNNVNRYYIIALFALLISGYGIIALGRAQFYTFFNFPMSKVILFSRYHYLCQVIIAIIFCLVLNSFANSRIKNTIAVIALIIASTQLYQYKKSVLNLTQFYRAISASSLLEYKKESAFLLSELKRQVNEPMIFIDNKQLNLFKFDKTSFPGLAALYIINYPDNNYSGKPVYFIEKNQEIFNRVTSRSNTRIVKLLKRIDKSE